MSSTLGIAIVTYNSAGVVGACLDSLLQYDQPVDVVVVDNNSADHTVQVCRDHAIAPYVIVSADNPGFATSINRAVAHLDTEFVLLLNPDAVINGADLGLLLSYMKLHPHCGVAGPMVLERSTDRVIPAGYSPTVFRMFTHMVGLSRLGNRCRALQGHYLFQAQVDGVHNVDWVTGACLMTSRAIWIRLGGLTTDWFMYGEDIEYCLRVRGLGLDVTLIGDARAEHLAGRSSDGDDGRMNTLGLENLFQLYKTRLAPTVAHQYVWRLTVGLGFAARSIVSRDPYNRKKFARYARSMARTR